MSELSTSGTPEDSALELRRHRTVQRLLRVLVHDLNNHLYAIQGFSELTVPALAPNVPAAANLQRVLDACEKAREVVELLSDHAQPGVRAPEPLDLQRAVPEWIRLLRRSRKAGVTLQVTIDPTAGRPLGRPAELHLLVTAMVDVAEVAIGDHPGTIEVSIRGLSAAGTHGAAERVRLAVSFGPAASAGSPGAGLVTGGAPGAADPLREPLELVRRLAVGLGGGDVVVDAGADGGRVAHVDLPVPDAAPAAGAGRDGLAHQPSLRVLFVDDERVLVELGREMLEFLGYEPEATTDGREALEWFGREPGRYACVVTDQTMPGISGEELVQRLKQLAPDVSIVVCTGHSEALTPERARELGVRAYFPKPFTISELGQAIQRAIAPRQVTKGE